VNTKKVNFLLENHQKRLKIGNKQLQSLFLRLERVNQGEKMEKNKKSMTEVGYPQGGKEVPTPKAGEVIKEPVKGMGNILPEKKRTAKII